jgi:hypothetical protein
MRKITLLSFIFVSIYCSSTAQNGAKPPDRLKIFIDCSGIFCDKDFIKTEITLVDFFLDQLASDVHILITNQQTGGGGSNYQLIFFGQNYFKGISDTLHFNTDANATDAEIRQVLVQYIKLGLAPYVSKTSSAKNVIITMKKPEGQKTSAAESAKKDPWNYWVYRIGANGNFQGEKSFQNGSYGANLSANRVTDQLKVSFSLNARKNKSVFTYEDPNGIDPPVKTINDNHNINFSHFLVKSINSHWSWGYEANFLQSTFSNLKSQVLARTGIEYDIYPYKDVNNKLFTISYKLGVQNNKYYDTTLYDKTNETLAVHSVDANLTFNQKWGSASVGMSYQNYLSNWKFFNLAMNAFINVRITGGLSFNVGAFGALTRDQIFLPKEGASQQDILTRRRQLASGYNYFTSFGINYRFGSKLNNFVNPRFEGGNGSFFF